MILLKNAKILTMAERDLEKGDILIGDGKIQRIGENIAAPAGAEIIDASGLTAMPGIVDALAISACGRTALTKRARTATNAPIP